MRIYKDILSGDELFTDSNKINLVDDCLYEVQCHHVTRKQGEIVLAGANPSAEEADETGGADPNVESGLDLVLNQRLTETSFDKSSYKLYLKSYTQALQEKWKEMGLSPDEIAEYKAKFMEAVKKVLPKLGDVSFYLGESCRADAMVALLDYRSKPDGTEDAFMLFFKHGLESEKV